MRLVPWFAVSLCLVVPALALAAPDPFAEFRIPAHRTRSGSVGLSYMGGRDHYGSERRTNGAGGASVAYAMGWDSDPLRLSFTTDLAADVDWSRQMVRYRGALSSERVDERQAEVQSWSLDASLRTYPWRRPLGLLVRAVGRGHYQQSWTDWDDLRRYDVPYSPELRRMDVRSSLDSYRTEAWLTLATGFGRVRDASVVYAVHVLERRLLEAGALDRELTPVTRERLAEVLYLRDGFAAAHEHPERFVWSEIERVLREAGELSDGRLGTFASLRSIERLEPEGTVVRQRGWFAGPIVTVVHAYQILRQDEHGYLASFRADTLWYEDDYRYSSRSTSSQDDLWAGWMVEYHRPLGWAWQFDVDGRLRHPLWPDERGLSAQSSASLRWRIADRWDAGARLGHNRDYLGPDREGVRMDVDSWQVEALADVGFYVEDHLRVSAAVSELQYACLNCGRGTFERHSTFRIGLAYRFLGALDAPGLIPPVRPAD